MHCHKEVGAILVLSDSARNPVSSASWQQVPVHRQNYLNVTQINKVKDFNARDDASIRHLIHRSNLVINLIGIQKETMNWSFEETHIDTAARIAEAVKDNDMVERFWHVSCLGASENSESRRLRSKVQLDFALLCTKVSLFSSALYNTLQAAQALLVCLFT